MFSGLKVPILCAPEDTKIILPSPVELAVSSREGRSSRVSRKWLKWFTLVEWVRRSLWKQKAGVTQLFSMITACDNLLGNGVHNHLQYGLHYKGDKVFLSRTKLHVALNIITHDNDRSPCLPVWAFCPPIGQRRPRAAGMLFTRGSNKIDFKKIRYGISLESCKGLGNH